MTTGPAHALYRFYGDDGALLYVGITLNPAGRFSQHAADKPWWHEVRGITMEPYPDRPSVLAAETRAITVENPRYNLQRPRAARRTPRPPRPQIVWLCNACGEPIDDGQGYLEVDMRAVYRVETYWREREERHPRTGHDAAYLDLSDLHEWPQPVPWLAHHADCDPDPDYSGYWIAIGRVRTHAQLLQRTSHLMGKGWLKHTNWDELIGRMSGVDA